MKFHQEMRQVPVVKESHPMSNLRMVQLLVQWFDPHHLESVVTFSFQEILSHQGLGLQA